MLELSKIARHIDNFGRIRAESLAGRCDEFCIASKTIAEINSSFDEARSKIHTAKTSWLVANFDEPPDKTYDLPSCPKRHAVLAVDGSQIGPGKHEIALCYLINTSAVALFYGVGERPWAETMPQLYYKDEELYETYAGRRVQVTDKLLSMKRTLAESAHLANALPRLAEKDLPAVALWDGSLIRWTLEGDPPDYRERALREYLKTFDIAKDLRIPIAGYISDPGGRDFVNALKVMLCPNSVVNCEKCDIPSQGDEQKPCDALGALTDAMTFMRILKPGQRSVLFTSSSNILKQYGTHDVRTFYMNLGREVTRVEVPLWVAVDREMLDLVHAVCWDQAQKGRGYPVALAQAHEWAVVQAPDRKAFFELIERSFIRHGVPVTHSLKRISKGY